MCLRTPLMWAAAEAGRPGAAEVVDSLLRAGADETVVDCEGCTAADVIGTHVQEEEESLTEEFERVRQLLANAPADRVWRRRGYLVLCRAHLSRVQKQLGRVHSDAHGASTGRRTRRRAGLVRAEGVTVDSRVGQSPDGEWALVMAKVLQLQEEGIFRTIVGYL
eukprot:g16033.t1